MRSARQTGRTIEVWAVLRHFRSEQVAAPLATLARLFLPTLQRKQSADADNFHRKV